MIYIYMYIYVLYVYIYIYLHIQYMCYIYISLLCCVMLYRERREHAMLRPPAAAAPRTRHAQNKNKKTSANSRANFGSGLPVDSYYFVCV